VGVKYHSRPSSAEVKNEASSCHLHAFMALFVDLLNRRGEYGNGHYLNLQI
jgi:hypothetical protein